MAALFLASPADGGDVSFRNDVMAVLSKAGCNQGVCHGNKNGKGGFKLSLRGEDPNGDFLALSRDLSGRRVNVVHPEESLILLKPTMQVPHEGGRRFSADDPEYRILKAWIAAGVPSDSDDAPRLEDLTVTPTSRVIVDPVDHVQLEAMARFSDGTTRDVTRLAVYETDKQTVEVSVDGRVQRRETGEVTVTVRYLDRQVPVRLAFIPARPDFAWSGPQPANFIDEHIFAKLRSLRMNPSPVCDDTVFIRRAYLDLLGLLPTAEEARQFVASSDPDKRNQLIDALLSRPEFAEFWAQKWSDLLRNEEKTLDRKGVQHFYAWIRHSIAVGKPLDQFVRELIASRGSTYSNPPANFYRALRDPLTRAESTAQLFLGVRLQCAKCHNHPFDRWTQDDYYSWANLFARVDYEIIENRRRDRNDKHEFDGEQIVYMADKGGVKHPETGQTPAPRFLAAGARPIDPDDDRLLQLAEWLTSPDNEQFARAQVNRIWYHLMGRGIVDPIDDFRATNPPANPELLDALADDFVTHGFDLRHTIRTMMRSRTYQLSAVPNETNRDDQINFSHALVRRLSAEQLADAVSYVTGVAISYNGYPLGVRAGALPGVRAIRFRDKRPSRGDAFLTLFGKPPRLETCECERSNETTLSQAFQLISGPLVNDLLRDSENRLGRLLGSQRTDAEIVEELYWTALSRPPTEDEQSAALAHLERASSRRVGLEDLAWSLMNANEFLLRR